MQGLALHPPSLQKRSPPYDRLIGRRSLVRRIMLPARLLTCVNSAPCKINAAADGDDLF